jgi:deoxycytidylate deaminase
MPNSSSSAGKQLQSLDYPEIFIALVAPTGSNSEDVCAALIDALGEFDYTGEVISLSALIGAFTETGQKETYASEYDRVKALIAEGDKLRNDSSDPTFVAKIGILEIIRLRELCLGASSGHLKYCEKRAYILRSLKRPEEIEFLRELYGHSLRIVSVYTPFDKRINNLALKISNGRVSELKLAQPKAIELVNQDEIETSLRFGQNTRDTFPLADYFLSTVNREELKEGCRRFAGLLFGDPFITPNSDEVAMFAAYGTSLRSCDLSRQVGAAIASTSGDIMSTGCNEVPSAGGGLYWGEQVNSMRDLELGFDSNNQIKNQLKDDWISDINQEFQRQGLTAVLADSFKFRNFDMIEFGRAVHAEMAALSSAVLHGIQVKGARLFSTTFPCHLCAKHIVACGIAEVVFIEPYPKSRTSELFNDSIDVNMNYLGNSVREKNGRISEKVTFRPFLGVAPRAYADSFRLEGIRKDSDGKVIKFVTKKPKFRIFLPYYLSHELAAIQNLRETGDKNERN